MNFKTVDARVGSRTISFIENDQFIGPSIANGREWESWMRDDVATFYRKGTDILDVGGNIGCNALMFSDFGPVHTFEPLFHTLLQKNVDQNELVHPVKVWPFGLSSTSGSKNIHVPKLVDGKCNYGACSFNPHENFNPDSNISVQIERLDDVYKGVPSFIKIDAELHELEVLKGAENTIRTHKPALLVEVYIEYGQAKVVEFLTSLGYTRFVQRPENNCLFIHKDC